MSMALLHVIGERITRSGWRADVRYAADDGSAVCLCVKPTATCGQAC